MRDRDEIYLPVGNAQTSFVDVRDIGAVAALALTQAGHERQAYELTGAEALDYYQVADLFTQVLGRKITYRNPADAAFLARQIQTGALLMFALVTTWLYRNTRNGMATRVTDEIERLTERPPKTLRQYIQDYRACWLR